MSTSLALSAIVPPLALTLPGFIALAVPDWRRLPTLTLLSRVLATGTILLLLLPFTAPLLHLPRYLLLALSAASGLVMVMLYARIAARLSRPLAIGAALYLLSITPYLTVHQALPTGDAQKAIFWAQRLTPDSIAPDYQLSPQMLNRDPIDFYTPALHAATATLMYITPQPLAAIGFLSIAFALAGAALAGALAAAATSARPRLAAAIALLLVLTNLRYLRYLREPGYHFQNLAGEVLLWGMLLLAVSLTKRWHAADLALLTLGTIALVVTHQFTAFLAPFVIGTALLVAVLTARSHVHVLIRRHRTAASLAATLLLVVILLGLLLDLDRKLPHLFTTNPHLLPLVPAITRYPALLGTTTLYAGSLGLLYLFVPDRSRQQTAARRAVASAGLALLILSQAPRLFIDIPPTRALLYAVVPLSAAAAVTAIELLPRLLAAGRRHVIRYALVAALALAVVMDLSGSARQAYALSHTVRTNSTLQPEYQKLIDVITRQPGAVLVDDYNRRAASWLLLSHQPTYARIAADLEQAMNEARQSPLRHRLYLNQLDFEKIFTLGSRPEITALMEKHSIRYITGIRDSSYTSLQYNSILQPVAQGDDVTLFELKKKNGQISVAKGIRRQEMDDSDKARGAAGRSPATSVIRSGHARSAGEAELSEAAGGDPRRQDPPASQTLWLLRASTLANDIGDREDTFEHLPASLRTTRLSEPQHDGATTWRTTTAPLIPLQFNVNDFVRALWDKERTGYPDIDVELLVQTTTPTTMAVSTTTNSPFVLTSGELLKIPSRNVPFDSQGNIVLTLHNPQQQSINLDLIALGLARTP